MPTTPLRADKLDDGLRPRDWQPRKTRCKIPFRLLRLCLLGALLPASFVAGPLYLRYRVYSEQLYPLTISDQRLIDSRVSTLWCQSQVVRVNTTFNAYLMREKPRIKNEVLPVSMTRHLVLEDDMKEYWGFYLLRGSSVTVSTCVRWPGASLTIIRGHKHLHECAFIGDDSSEELDEMLEVEKERGELKINGSEQDNGISNEPEKMKRARQDVHFHNKDNHPHENNTLPGSHVHHGSHELDAKAMRNILKQLLIKTSDTKKKQKEHPHHRYEGVFKESANIDRPVNASKSVSVEKPTKIENSTAANETRILTAEKSSNSSITTDNVDAEGSVNEEAKLLEMLRETLSNINKLEDHEKSLIKRLNMIKKLNQTKSVADLTDVEKRRIRRDLIISSPLYKELNEEDDESDTVIEQGMLHPDDIAEDRGTINETTFDDRSNSEFWSSFSSSEERLLDCKGLILNLPLTPHKECTPKHESRHTTASFANTVTYRVPTDGYYFFVFNSENEIQPNYLRVKFDLLKTVYNISNPVHVCKNQTSVCTLPFNIFSDERTVLELPIGTNDSQWNEEYVVISTCEPRTAIYLVCIVMVPLLIMVFAFQ